MLSVLPSCRRIFSLHVESAESELKYSCRSGIIVHPYTTIFLSTQPNFLIYVFCNYFLLWRNCFYQWLNYCFRQPSLSCHHEISISISRQDSRVLVSFYNCRVHWMVRKMLVVSIRHLNREIECKAVHHIRHTLFVQTRLFFLYFCSFIDVSSSHYRTPDFYVHIES